MAISAYRFAEVDAERARHAYIERMRDWLKQLHQDSSQYNLTYERSICNNRWILH